MKYVYFDTESMEVAYDPQVTAGNASRKTYFFLRM